MDLTVEQILKFISDYGLAFVLSAILIYIICKFIGIGFKYLDKKMGNKAHDKLIDTRTNVSEKVQGLIDLFLVQSHGDRVQVLEFSNSVMSVAYLPFKYMTCTYEVYKFGLAPQGAKLDHLSTSLFTTFFTNLQDKPYCIFDVEKKDNLMGGAMYGLMTEHSEKKSLCVMLYTLKGKAIGYISLKKDEDFTQNDIDGIQLIAKQISALLSVVDK